MASWKKVESTDSTSGSHSNPLRRLGSAVLNRRRPNNTPAITSNSYTNVGPSMPGHDEDIRTAYQVPTGDDTPSAPQHSLRSLFVPQLGNLARQQGSGTQGLPRSRTFSSLPQPTTSRKVPDKPVSASHHAPQIPPLLRSSPTRLPSPKSTTRKHSSTRLNTADISSASGGPPRSNTMPILSRNRTFIHMENHPSSDFESDAITSLAETSEMFASPRAQQERADTGESSEPLLGRSHEPSPLSKPGFMQRRNSQPVLTSSPSRKESHRPIEQKSLMTTISPQPRPSYLNLLQRPAAPNLHITDAKSPAYWTGMFSGLNDRYRNEGLSTPDLGATEYNSSDADIERMGHVLEEVYARCGNGDAKKSFLAWQEELVIQMPCLKAVLIKEGSSKDKAPESSKRGEGTEGEPSDSGKTKRFIDRVLGKGPRKSNAHGT